MTAGPRGLGYRFRRFVVRNRFAVAAGLVLFLALAAGLATVSWQAFRATEAEQRQRELRARAERSQRVADAVNDFLIGVLRSPDPREDGADVRVVDCLAQGAERVDEEFGDDPVAAAEVLSAIGATYRSLGQLDAAQSALERALAYWERETGRLAGRKSHVLNLLGILARQRGDLDVAEDFFRRSVAACEAYAPDELSTDKERRLFHDTMARITYNLATFLARRNKLEDAGVWFDRTVAIHREHFGDEPMRVGIVLGGQVLLRNRSGDLVGAEAAAAESLEQMRRAFPEPHPYLIVCLLSMAHASWELDHREEVGRHAAEALELAREVLPDGDEQLGMAYRRRGSWLDRQGEHEAAAELLRRSVEIGTQRFGADSSQVAVSRTAHARSLLTLDGAAALEAAQHAVEILEAARDPLDEGLIRARLVLARAMLLSEPDADVEHLTAGAVQVLEEEPAPSPGLRALYAEELQSIRTLSGR